MAQGERAGRPGPGGTKEEDPDTLVVQRFNEVDKALIVCGVSDPTVRDII